MASSSIVKPYPSLPARSLICVECGRTTSQQLAESAATAEPGDPDYAEPSRSTAGDTLRERAANR